MSAKRLFALLVVVVLGLLLTSPIALSRSEMPRYVEGGWTEPDDPQVDGDDPTDPNYVSGDDDNWDKPVVKGHNVGERGGAEDGVGTGVGTNNTGDKLSRMEIGLRLQLVLIVRSWFILAGAR